MKLPTLPEHLTSLSFFVLFLGGFFFVRFVLLNLQSSVQRFADHCLPYFLFFMPFTAGGYLSEIFLKVPLNTITPFSISSSLSYYNKMSVRSYFLIIIFRRRSTNSHLPISCIMSPRINLHLYLNFFSPSLIYRLTCDL